MYLIMDEMNDRVYLINDILLGHNAAKNITIEQVSSQIMYNDYIDALKKSLKFAIDYTSVINTIDYLPS